MSSFAHLPGLPGACLGFGRSPATGEGAEADAGEMTLVLHARLLWLVCALAVAFGCVYSVYFVSIDLLVATPIGPVCIAFSALALGYARASGRYDRAFEIIGVLLFAMVATVSLFQDGIRSPALWWLVSIPVITLLAGRIVVGCALSVLFVAHAWLLHLHGPGSWGPVSLLAADRAFQLTLSMTLSALFVGVCAGLGSRWGLQLRRALELGRAAAVAAGASKARFVSHLSHEIRTPLHGMIGAIEMLADPGLHADCRDGLVEVQRQSAEMLMALVTDVLDFSKLEAGKLMLERRPVRLARLVERVHAFFAPQASSKGIELVWSCSPDVPEVLLGDATRIRQVVTNLVANAIKFTSQGSVHIHVGLDGQTPRAAPLADDGMRVRIAVADSGFGIGAEMIDALFKPFHQADETITRRFGGTGLGLAISDDLARLMRGSIEVTSAPGRGSTFTLVAPLGLPERRARAPSAPRRGRVLAAAATGDAPTAAPHDRRPVVPLPNGLEVLVVEDDPPNQAVVVAMLELLQVRATLANNGREALALLESRRVDAVLMDLQMPGLDGQSATRVLRLRERSAGAARTPIVAMTGSTEADEVIACMAAGMDAVLAKPFTLAQLRQALLDATSLRPR